MTKVFEAKGKYARTILVKTEHDKCFECEKQKELLSFDSSAGEYSTMNFCIECLNEFANGKISKSNYMTKNFDV